MRKELTDHESLLGVAQEIEQRLWRANIAYGPEDDPRLWRISPRYFVIREETFDQIQALAFALPVFINGVNSGSDDDWDPNKSYYFRFDATIARGGNVVPLEFQNEVPVEDATVDANRAAYQDLIPLPEGYFNPFGGSINGIARTLSSCDRAGNIAIVVPNSRSSYLRDYSTTSEVLTRMGFPTTLVNGDLTLSDDGLYNNRGRIDLIYRAFTRRDLLGEKDNLPHFEILRKAYESNLVDIFPPLSPALEDKGVMAMLYMPEYEDTLKGVFGESLLFHLRKQFPYTWLADADNPPVIDGSRRDWGSYFMSEEAWREGYVLKPRRSFGSSGMIISREISLPKWRDGVVAALTIGSGGYVLQRHVDGQRYFADVLENGAIVRTEKNLGVRLSVTCLVSGGEVNIAEVDACLSKGFRIHGTKDSVLMPVVVKRAKND